MLVSFSVQAGIIASLVISISPDKAGPPVTGRGITRTECRAAVLHPGVFIRGKDGETLAGIGPVFRQKFTIKAGNIDTGRGKETMSLNTMV